MLDHMKKTYTVVTKINKQTKIKTNNKPFQRILMENKKLYSKYNLFVFIIA